MLKIEINEQVNRVEHSGDPVRVAAEIACVAGTIYNGYRTVNKGGAELLRLAFIKMLLPDSGVWNPGEGDLTTIVIPKNNKKGGAPTDQS
jgi:hypothetical protein